MCRSAINLSTFSFVSYAFLVFLRGSHRLKIGGRIHLASCGMRNRLRGVIIRIMIVIGIKRRRDSPRRRRTSAGRPK